LREIREYCISKPDVTEGSHFNDTTLVFKVAGKMFALPDLPGNSRKVALKFGPEQAIPFHADLRYKFKFA
jgi:predicted DNA-binding protein (MmcQ/YjbR family)